MNRLYQKPRWRRLLACGFMLAMANGSEQSLANSSSPGKDRLHIAVAANFRPTMQKLAPHLEANGDFKLTFSFSATGALFQQIVYGAPFDVFLAADSMRPAELERKNLILTDSRHTYAIGRLSLYSSQLNVNPKALLSKPGTRIAIANPRLAPYGKAAIQTLQAWGLWPSIKPQLVYGKDIAQTFLFANSHHVQVAFVSAAQVQALAAKAHNTASHFAVASQHHSPIKQQAVVLVRSKVPEAALQFMQLLLAPESQLLIEQSGYRLPATTTTN